MWKTIVGPALLIALGATSLTPFIAQATSSNIACNATTALGNGASLSYAVTGSIELDGAGRPVPPTDRASSLLITVQRRDRNGKLQTLLNRAPLEHWEQVAPDADYSLLPFSGNFRGKPNDGRGLYVAQRSVNGLYVSLRPVDRLPSQLQVVHYLSAGQFVRSAPGSCRSVP